MDDLQKQTYAEKLSGEKVIARADGSSGGSICGGRSLGMGLGTSGQ